MIGRNSAVMVAIDFQGSLFQVMHDKDKLLANAVGVVRGARILNLPAIVTQQVPSKLGPTVPAIAREMQGITPVDKESFSCWDNKIFREKLETFSRNNIIVCGIECHVCVYQTVVDLIENGYMVHVVADAVSSRTKENRRIGLTAMEKRGAKLTSAEMLLFELLRTAADPKAKEIFKIVK